MAPFSKCTEVTFAGRFECCTAEQLFGHLTHWTQGAVSHSANYGAGHDVRAVWRKSKVVVVGFCVGMMPPPPRSPDHFSQLSNTCQFFQLWNTSSSLFLDYFFTKMIQKLPIIRLVLMYRICFQRILRRTGQIISKDCQLFLNNNAIHLLLVFRAKVK